MIYGFTRTERHTVLSWYLMYVYFGNHRSDTRKKKSCFINNMEEGGLG